MCVCVRHELWGPSAAVLPDSWRNLTPLACPSAAVASGSGEGRKGRVLTDGISILIKAVRGPALPSSLRRQQEDEDNIYKGGVAFSRCGVHRKLLLDFSFLFVKYLVEDSVRSHP